MENALFAMDTPFAVGYAIRMSMCEDTSKVSGVIKKLWLAVHATTQSRDRMRRDGRR
jgi:hypothetical protein